MTNKQLAELIQRRLAGGDVPAGFSPKIEELVLWIKPSIAAAAMKNYSDTAAVDVENVGDAFYITYKNIALTKDESSGLYEGSVPAAAYALPFGFDVRTGYLEGSGKLAPMVRVNARHIDTFRKIAMPLNSVFYWFEGSKVMVFSEVPLTGKSVRFSMASNGGGLNDTVNCPDDYINYVIDYVERKFINPMPEDLSNDGNNKR